MITKYLYICTHSFSYNFSLFSNPISSYLLISNIVKANFSLATTAVTKVMKWCKDSNCSFYLLNVCILCFLSSYFKLHPNCAV